MSDKQNINNLLNFPMYNKASIAKYAMGHDFHAADTNSLLGFAGAKPRATKTLSRDRQGYVFFTRPQLNLSDNNLKKSRTYNQLVNADPKSVERYVRCTLDPRLQNIYDMRSDLCDPHNPFIPILTNTIKSLSGFPDLTVETASSTPGLRKETHVMVDGQVTYYQEYDVDATFTNTIMEPVLRLFYIWAHYTQDVAMGDIMPYNDMLSRNEIDYNTRIYRLVMDETNRFVSKIVATGASFPATLPIGSWSDYASEEIFNTRNQELNIRFKCMGMTVLDTITINEFNRLMCIFNPEIRNCVIEGREPSRDRSLFYKVTPETMQFFNTRLYPYIGENNELCWLASLKDKYHQETFKAIKDMGIDDPFKWQNI